MRILLCAGTALLALALVGCNKMTGGGWLTDIDGDRISFAFNAQRAEEPTESCNFGQGPSCVAARGKFILIDHGDVSGDKLRFRGTFDGTWSEQSPFACEPTANTPCASVFEGFATMNGEDYLFYVDITDNGEGGDFIGDNFFVMFSPAGGGDPIVYAGTLEGGNLQVHLKG